MTGATNFGTEGQILYDANKKSKLVSYLLWFFLGGFGAHRFYNRRIKSAIAQLLTVIGGYGLAMTAIWPTMQQGMQAAQAAAEKGESFDPATMPPPTPEQLAAAEAAFQHPMFLIGAALVLAYIIWWIVDAFLIPGWVRRHNEELARSLAGR